MPLDIQPFTHAPLHWSDGLPAVFDGPRLPGSAAMYSQGGFGTIALQEVNTAHYSIRYLQVHAKESLAMRMRILEGDLHAQLSLEGHSSITINGDTARLLRKHQYILMDMSTPQIVADYIPGIEYHFFDTTIAKEGSEELRQAMQASGRQWNGPSGISHAWASGTAIGIVQDILHCRYAGALLLYYYRNRVMDLFLQYALQWKPQQPAIPLNLPMAQLEGVYAAERLITEDLSKHLGVRELCRRTGLNEFDLKTYFPKVYGMGPYEYLFNKRMEYARKLLEDGASVKVAAASIGMRPQHFSVSFRKHFGFHASRLMK